jgi:hypothetical protein
VWVKVIGLEDGGGGGREDIGGGIYGSGGGGGGGGGGKFNSIQFNSIQFNSELEQDELLLASAPRPPEQHGREHRTYTPEFFNSVLAIGSSSSSRIQRGPGFRAHEEVLCLPLGKSQNPTRAIPLRILPQTDPKLPNPDPKSKPSKPKPHGEDSRHREGLSSAHTAPCPMAMAHAKI